MAATYAALVSLTHLLDHIQLSHFYKPLFLDKQLRQLEFLRNKVNFLLDFLENYAQTSSYELSESFKSRIADAVYNAEDVIESYVVGRVCARFGEVLEEETYVKTRRPIFTCLGYKKKNLHHFSHCLNKVLKNMDSVRRVVIDIQKCGDSTLKDQQHFQERIPLGSLGPPPTRTDIVVEFEILNDILSKLTIRRPENQTIPITGMGGIGKSTLAKMVFDSPVIMQHFDIRGWVTISQEYRALEILSILLHQVNVHVDKDEHEHELGDKLYKHLFGRRYLIIIDDIWSIEVWYELKRFLPNNNNGSAIMITTRLSEIAYRLKSSDVYKMKLLDENKSWDLFCKVVNCPPDLKAIGERIVRNCKGLPLSLTVIGGLLAKSEATREYWEYVAGDLSTTVNSEDEDRWLKVLSLSYNHLPIHLKPCFLYFGVFPEDCGIKISELKKLWVAEGFLRPKESKCLEDVAEDYLKDLVDRNLIFISETGSTGKMKTCKIHDLMRDLCLREAPKEDFFCESNNSSNSQGEISHRRIVIHPSMTGGTHRSDSSTRSVISNMDVKIELSSKLLKVLNCGVYAIEDIVCQLINSCYIRVYVHYEIPSSICHLWNLQTIIICRSGYEVVVAPSEIWEMPQLRHVKTYGSHLSTSPDPQSDQVNVRDVTVLENLQSLSSMHNFKVTGNVFTKISNIRKLTLRYDAVNDVLFYDLDNLSSLRKLQSLNLISPSHWMIEPFNIEFPLSLKKLTLKYFYSGWEEISRVIGYLPNLEKLILTNWEKSGTEWNPVEGEFIRLKYLKLDFCNLACWNAEKDSFPCLEHLVLQHVAGLKEIPFGIGDIPTLKSIHLNNCYDSAITSVKKILHEQRNMGNECFSLYVGGEYVQVDSDYEEEENEDEETEDEETEDEEE